MLRLVRRHVSFTSDPKPGREGCGIDAPPYPPLHAYSRSPNVQMFQQGCREEKPFNHDARFFLANQKPKGLDQDNVLIRRHIVCLIMAGCGG